MNRLCWKISSPLYRYKKEAWARDLPMMHGFWVTIVHNDNSGCYHLPGLIRRNILNLAAQLQVCYECSLNWFSLVVLKTTVQHLLSLQMIGVFLGIPWYIGEEKRKGVWPPSNQWLSTVHTMQSSVVKCTCFLLMMVHDTIWLMFANDFLFKVRVDSS